MIKDHEPMVKKRPSTDGHYSHKGQLYFKVSMDHCAHETEKAAYNRGVMRGGSQGVVI